MAEKPYRASLSRSQGRAGWSIIFRHPVRRDEATGRRGIRIRRGLGTRDQAEAEDLRDQLNDLLTETRYHQANARAEAERRFNKWVVEIFYDKMVPEKTDFRGIREAAIPLPDPQHGDYRRVLLLGTTGAGKTTLVRQLLGTDPVKERFPSTSTAKTTVHDMEIVVRDGLWRATVTFVSGDEVREYVTECVSAAVLAAWRRAPDDEILRRVLAHVNQRFRFNYVLGNGPSVGGGDFDGEDDEDEEGATEPDPMEGLKSTAIDIAVTNDVLAECLGVVKEIAQRHGHRLRMELDATDESDERVIDELFEEELDNLLREDEAFHGVADELMDEIEKRFTLLELCGEMRTRQGWPLFWTWETDDREVFMRTISRFSSNYAPLFGWLLTPLVNGIRVEGSFSPTWMNGERPRLALLDGEGLGHTPNSSAAVSTEVSRRIEEADAVVLVDDATQPMQAAPVAAMRELVSSGNAAKLILAFTHFDEVKGDNLPTPSSRVQHVLSSAENVLSAIGDNLGPFAERALRKRIEVARHFLGGIQEPLSSETKEGARTIRQLHKLLECVDEVVERPEPAQAKPTYDLMDLVLAVKSAAESFHDVWFSRLGLENRLGVGKEHWARVKALSRRLATGMADEYDSLRPVADLRKELQDRIYVFVQNPLRWEGPEPSDDEKQFIFDSFADSMGRRILALATRRIKDERVQEWQSAYDKHGPGSTFVRAGIIGQQIYDPAAPIPDVTPSPDRNQFMREVAREVQAAAAEVGVTLI